MAADGGRIEPNTPHFELLEDRIVLDGVPEVTITGPEGGIDLGAQDVPLTLTFDNTGTDRITVGTPVVAPWPGP